LETCTVIRTLFAAACAIAVAPPAFAQTPTVPKPAAITADGIPTVPASIAASTRRYMEFRSAAFSGWHPQDKSMLVATRFANTNQVHRVESPMATRTQLSFEAEPVPGASWAPKRGDVMVVQKDTGGDEFFQIYTLKDGALALLTDGKSRNTLGSWSMDGQLIGYSSTRRNGTDTDLYIMNPRDPKTDRMVAQVTGGGWNIAGFAPDGKSAIVIQYLQITKSNPWLLDIATGKLTPIGDHRKPIAYGNAQFASDGTLWVTSDEASEFQRLGSLDPKSGKFTAKGPAERWDVESFDIAPDGRFIAYVINEAGINRLRMLDLATGTARTVEELGQGVIGAVQIAEWGEIGLSFASPKNPADAFSVDPQSLKVTRWTASETGGLEASQNATVGLGLPFPTRRRQVCREAPDDHEHPRWTRSAITAGISGAQQLSAQRTRHCDLLSQCSRVERLWQELRQRR
jgi:WD40-like Beta Propeller Repeat